MRHQPEPQQHTREVATNQSADQVSTSICLNVALGPHPINNQFV